LPAVYLRPPCAMSLQSSLRSSSRSTVTLVLSCLSFCGSCRGWRPPSNGWVPPSEMRSFRPDGCHDAQAAREAPRGGPWMRVLAPPLSAPGLK
jgi:hypothetical protein